MDSFCITTVDKLCTHYDAQCYVRGRHFRCAPVGGSKLLAPEYLVNYSYALLELGILKRLFLYGFCGLWKIIFHADGT